MRGNLTTPSSNKMWGIDTYELSIYDDRIAPDSKWEFYSEEEVELHRGMYAKFYTSYVQSPTAHCVKIEDFNKFIECYISDDQTEN